MNGAPCWYLMSISLIFTIRGQSTLPVFSRHFWNSFTNASVDSDTDRCACKDIFCFVNCIYNIYNEGSRPVSLWTPVSFLYTLKSSSCKQVLSTEQIRSSDGFKDITQLLEDAAFSALQYICAADKTAEGYGWNEGMDASVTLTGRVRWWCPHQLWIWGEHEMSDFKWH